MKYVGPNNGSSDEGRRTGEAETERERKREKEREKGRRRADTSYTDDSAS